MKIEDFRKEERYIIIGLVILAIMVIGSTLSSNTENKIHECVMNGNDRGTCTVMYTK